MKILAVMVVYKQNILSSTTLQSLIGSISKHGCEDRISILIYDNSPSSQHLDCLLPLSVSYVHDPTNPGLAKAYNYAVENAVSDGCDWLLLLDQDTCLPENFTENLLNTARILNADENIVAIVPRVKCLGMTVSPSIVKFGGYYRPVEENIVGICPLQVTSINSGTLLRTAFIKTIGGFNKFFWLDYLDHWVFSIIHSRNKRVFLSQSVIDHELSVTDYDRWMNLERYVSILKAERLFLETCRPKYEKYFYIVRLLKRMISQLFDYKNSAYYKSTYQAFKNILLNIQDKGTLH